MRSPYSSCVSLIVLFASSTALAQSPSVQAEALFNHGKKLMKEAKYAEACAAFDASEELEPLISTELNQADCREQNRQLATAWEWFLKAAENSRQRADAPGKQMHALAVKRAERLASRVSTLTITSTEHVDGIQVHIRIEGRESQLIEPRRWNLLPIDGGRVEITATAPGREPQISSIDVPIEGGATRFVVPVLTTGKPDVVVTVPTKPVEPKPLSPAEPPPRSAPPRHRSKLWPIVASSVALGLEGVAAFAFRQAKDKYEEAIGQPNNVTQDRQWNDANKLRYLAEGAAIAGLATAGVAVWLWVRTPSTKERPKNVSIIPSIASDRAYVGITADW